MATILGSDAGETLEGENTDDTIIALAGDDTLEGGAGNDTLLGGSGNDSYVFRSGFGHDEIIDSSGNEKLLFKDATGLEEFSILLNDEGDVVITTAGGSVDIAGARYEDGRYSIHFGESDELLGKLAIGIDSNHLSGDAGKDWLVGLDGDDVLEGGGGDDILAGGAGADTLDGGDGRDQARYDSSSQGVRVSLLLQGQSQIDFDGTDGFTANNNEAVGDILTNIESIEGSDHDDWLTGDGDNNRLYGGAGDDRLEGGAGYDRLEGGAGADILDGGDGRDTASYSSSSQGVRVSLLLQGQSQIDFDGTHGFTANNNEAVGDILTNIESIEGSDHDDWLTGDGGNNYLYGYDGDDHLESDAGSDRLEGGAGNDRLYGGAGRDRLYGGAGNDRLYGGAGDDHLESGAGNDFLYGGAGDDLLAGYVGDNHLYGGAGDDLLYSGEGTDTFDGGDGTDVVSYYYAGLGGVRVDLSRVGAQQDFDGTHGFTPNSSDAVGDILTNIENIYGSSGDDWLTGDGGNNYLRAGSGNDRLEGGAGDDSLDGGIGDDRLEGGAGDDSLDGGSGDDQLYGGEGADTYWFASAGAYYDDGTDTIHDEAGDTMTLQFRDVASSNPYTASDFVEASNNFKRVGNNLEISIGRNEITILNAYDSDPTTGTGTAAFTIRIEYRLGDEDIFTEVTNDFWHNFFAKGSEENPFLATAAADFFVGSDGADWVSYAESPSSVVSGIYVELRDDGSVGFFGWAADDDLYDINNIIGSDAGDRLYGNRGDNILRGGSGNDELYGGDGNDHLEGGSDNDELYGGDGNDHLEGGSGYDRLYGNEGNDHLEGGLYSDRLYGGAGNDHLSGGAGYDHLYGGAGADILDGGTNYDSGYRSGTDTAYYSSSSQGVRVDLSNVEAQIDFNGKHGFTANNNEAVGDRLSGIEDIEGSDHDDWLTGDENANELVGGSGNDRLEGGDGDDRFYGNQGDDILEGGAGADTLEGGFGDDRLEGGLGADTYTFDSGDGTDTIADEAGDTLTLRFEDYSYTSSNFVEGSNNFDRVGNNLEITIDKNPDDAITDKITILNAYDDDSNTGIGNAAFTINIEYGRSSNTLTEVSNGFWHNLFAKGSEERPFLATRAADTFAGTDGEDWDWVSYEGSTSGVSVDLRTTPATVSTAWAIGDTLSGINNLVGSSGSDIFFGNGDDNTLRGGMGEDYLYGNAGADTLEGGAGSDQLFGHEDADTLEGGAGDDRLYGGEGADSVDGGDGLGDFAGYYYSSQGVRVDLSNTGGQQDFDGTHGFTANNNEAVGDIISGIEGITGSYHDDWLTGDDNDNHLYGDAGDDRLEGGLGADTYTFDSGDGTDTIADEAGDTLTLRFEDYSYTASDFVEGSNNFNRVGDDLEISIDKNPYDAITDKITILNAYDSDPDTGIGNAAFTISIEYGYGSAITEVSDAFWHNLA